MWITDRHSLAMACCMVGLTTALASCDNPIPEGSQVRPIQETVWTGHPGALTEWGYGPDYIYGVLALEGSEGRLLVCLAWQGDTLTKETLSKLPRSLDVVPAMDGLCGLYYKKNGGHWPYALMRSQDGQVLGEWATTPGWWVRNAGGSPNGRFIALLAEDGVYAPGYQFMHPRARVAIIDVDKRDLRWVADVNGDGAYTVRQIAVTNDGRYIAVAGWNNGTAMVDAKEGKVLWSRRPEGEISTGYAVFASDGKVLFTAGSEGCVYVIDVATGNVIAQRWATTTGKSIYAHRVSALAVSGDGEWLAAGTGPEGEVYLWNTKPGGGAQMLPHGDGSIEIVAFSPNGRSLVSVGGGALKVWPLGNPSTPQTNPKATGAAQ